MSTASNPSLTHLPPDPSSSSSNLPRGDCPLHTHMKDLELRPPFSTSLSPSSAEINDPFHRSEQQAKKPLCLWMSLQGAVCSHPEPVRSDWCGAARPWWSGDTTQEGKRKEGTDEIPSSPHLSWCVSAFGGCSSPARPPADWQQQGGWRTVGQAGLWYSMLCVSADWRD